MTKSVLESVTLNRDYDLLNNKISILNGKNEPIMHGHILKRQATTQKYTESNKRILVYLH